MGVARLRVALVAILAMASLPRDARAYEFELSARTIGQFYDLPWYNPFINRQYHRRRFTELLTLNIWDLTGQRRRLRLHDPEPGGHRVSFVSHLRINHDFGGWTMGTVGLPTGVSQDAIDLIPELEHEALQLDVLYAYMAAQDLFGGLVDVRLGRQLGVDALDWWSYDGASVRVKTPWYLAVEGIGGLRVGGGSLLASAVHMLDGTAEGECSQYVASEQSYQPIDFTPVLDLRNSSAFRADGDYCPQREQLEPTWGAAIESHGLGWLSARVAYRRTMSQTAGIRGPIDESKLPFPDEASFYPDEFGQAPGWGIDEEHVSATVRANLALRGGSLQLDPHLAVRYSLLHGLIDEAGGGVRARLGMHSVEPEVAYSFPTFDGDSIFNVFSVEPFTDFRITYAATPRRSRWQAMARGWVRQFETEDADMAESGAVVQAKAYANGGQLSGGFRFAPRRVARIDLFHEFGYGGRRTGAMAFLRWQLRPTLELNGRASVVSFQRDQRHTDPGVSGGGQLGATYLINLEGVAVHLLLDEVSNRYDHFEFRALGILDLAFQPET